MRITNSLKKVMFAIMFTNIMCTFNKNKLTFDKYYFAHYLIAFYFTGLILEIC
ncbi:hypothetical protein HCUR_00105 [Holospora curviuscula]|uniref:Uncharacterized protein n=1 Tax=Holospora curviuscula TaxID=1082868 RepID=A0A2S5RHU5_9PROT|nr:hypothetical protein HCUR_00105 [Holospora curviuscula]